jgi:hypothetical protein
VVSDRKLLFRERLGERPGISGSVSDRHKLLFREILGISGSGVLPLTGVNWSYCKNFSSLVALSLSISLYLSLYFIDIKAF